MNIINLNLPKINYYTSDLQDKYHNGLLKDHLDALNYIQEYYFESSNGMYYFYNVDTNDFEFKTDKDFKKEVLDKIGNDKILTNKVKTNNKIYKIVSDLFKPRHYKIGKDYYINSCKGLLHKNYKNYADYSEEIKSNVQLYISYIKEIMCNNDNDMLDAYLKYYSQLARGKKTEIIIYRKSGEGTGKSTETDFIMNYVFGKEVCLISNTEPLLSNYNKIYLGKLIIIFEELPTFSDGQWSAVSSKLKTLTTEKLCVYRDLYEKGIQAENISNFQINTNVDSIKDSNGRRYVILDLNPSRVGDYEYFKKLKDNCFNLTVGEAFFSYLMTHITDEESNKFLGQRDFPETMNKRLTIANLLHSSYKFLKDWYLLTNLEADKKNCVELYNEYVSYCDNEKLRKCGRNDFYKKLETINIHRKKINGYWYFSFTIPVLKEIANKYKWICEYDDYEQPEEEKEKEVVDEETEKEEEDDVDYKASYEVLKLAYEKLQSKNKKLKSKVKKMNNDADDDNNISCDSCYSVATRKHDGDDLCDKCYLREKYKD